MSVIYWGIQIDLTDNTTDSVPSIGLYSGYLNWITGRPGYAGSGYSGEAPAGLTWKEGVITRSLPPMIRMTKEMDETGGYGGLSGFSVYVDDTLGLNNTLETNDYFILNRKIDVYCFLADVSYSVWSGVISKKVKSNSILKITCEDSFKNIHKQIPPNIITNEKFPNIDDNYIGEVIPITLGNVLRTKLINIVGRGEPLTIGKGYASSTTENVTTTYCIQLADGIYSLENNGDGNTVLRIQTPYMYFPEDYFINTGTYYLNVVKGQEQGILIIGSEETEKQGQFNATTKLVLSYMFDKITFAEFIANDGSGATLNSHEINENVWFFQIIKMTSIGLLSNNIISEIPLSDKGYPYTFTYNNNTKQYDDINELYLGHDTTVNNKYNHPYVNIIDNKINVEGDFNRLTPIKPEDIEFRTLYMPNGSIGTNTLELDESLLIDNDPDTYAEITATGADRILIRYKIKLPTSVVIKGLDQLFLLPKYSCDSDERVTIKTTITGYDPFEWWPFEDDTKYTWPLLFYHYAQNFLPSEYYNTEVVSQFGAYNPTHNFYYKDLFQVNESLVNSYNNGLAANVFQFEFDFTTVSTGDWLIRIHEFGFVGNKTLNTNDDEIYIKAKGETV